jgi:hypothetical protein
MNQKIGRNAKTGEFTTIREAQRKPSTHVVETIKRAPAAPAPAKKK